MSETASEHVPRLRRSLEGFTALLLPAGAVGTLLVALAGDTMFGSPVLVVTVVVSLAALHGFDLQVSRGPDRFALDVIEVPLVVAFVHLPVLGGVLAATAGHALGMWFETRDLPQLTDPGRTWDWLQFRANMTARMLGLAAGYALVLVVPTGSLGQRLGVGVLAGLVCLLVADLVIFAIAVKIVGATEARRMFGARGLYPLTALVGLGGGGLLALAGATLGAPAGWLLAGTGAVVWATWLHEHVDTSRRRLQGLMAASRTLQATVGTAATRDGLVEWARRLLHAHVSELRIDPPTEGELGVRLPGDDDTERPFLVVAQRRGLVSSFRRRDRELLTGLADLGATALARAELHDELDRRASRDELTGLANRWLVIATFEQMVATARRQDTAVAVLFVDVNRLKLVNDQHGHEAGDALLAEVSDRLVDQARESDLVGRWGGDEFVVLAGVASSTDTKGLVDRFRKGFVQSLAAARGLPAGASIGVACWPDDAPTLEALLEQADQAMYSDKARTRRPISTVEPGVDTP